MTKTRITVDLVSADGSAYNDAYNRFLIYLFAKHGEALSTVQQALQQAQNTEIQHADRDTAENIQRLKKGLAAVLQKIREDVNHYDLSHLPADAEIAKMTETITKKGCEQFDSLRQHLRDKLKKTIKREAALSKAIEEEYPAASTEDQKYMAQMNYYLDIFKTTDPNLLSEIMVKTNPDLIRELSSHAETSAIQYIGISSRRQSYALDLANRKNFQTGSIFEDVMYLTSSLRCKAPERNIVLQPLTMTDIASKLPCGESFRRIITRPVTRHETFVGDKSRLTLVYAIGHEMASRYRGADILINFNTGDDATLQALHQIYHDNPDMLPKGVTLRLRKYNGKFDEPLEDIHGTSDYIDDNYRENLFDLLHTNFKPEAFPVSDMAKNIDIPQFLANRKPRRVEKSMAVLLDADGCFYNPKFVYLIYMLLLQFGNEISEMAKPGVDPEARAALIAKLKERITSTDDAMFSEESKDSIFANILSVLPLIEIDEDITSDIDYLSRLKHKLGVNVGIVRQYQRYLERIDPEIISVILRRANLALLTDIKERARRAGCTHVIFFVGSNRQSNKDDFDNMALNGTGRFLVDYERFIKSLNQQENDGITFSQDYFLLADAYNDLTPGAAYRISLENSDEFGQPFSIFDDSKANLLYGFSQYIARYYPEIKNALLYDDRHKILERLVKVYGSKDQFKLFPDGMKICMLPYVGNTPDAAANLSITGSGVVDPDFDLSLNLMARLCGVDLRTYDTHRQHVDAVDGDSIDFHSFAVMREAGKSLRVMEFDALTRVPGVVKKSSLPECGFFTPERVKANTVTTSATHRLG